MSANTEGMSPPRPGPAAVASIVAALGLTLIVVPAAGPPSPWTIWAYIAGAVALLLGVIGIAWDMRQTIESASTLRTGERARLFGQYLFDRHATGLAFFFMVVVLLVGVVTTMMLYNGQLAVTARDFAAQLSSPTPAAPNGKGKVLAIVLLLSIALSWCGAGLFVVQRLELKRDDPSASFNFLEFFRGIWSRVGQANLYTLLFFLLIWANGDAVASERVPGGTNTAVAWDIVKSYAWLPILGLVSGLLVKSAESVVFGLGTRLLAAVSAFLGSDRASSDGANGTSARTTTSTQPKGPSADDLRSSAPTHAAPVDAPPAKSPSAVEPTNTAPVQSTELTSKAASSSPALPTPPAPATKSNGTHTNGSTHAPASNTPPTTPVALPSPKREAPAPAPFTSAFSVPTTVPAPSATGSMTFGASSPKVHAASHAPARVVPVPMPAPTTIDVRPTIVPIEAPTSTSVMVNVERPDVPTLQDVVGPSPTTRPQTSTTGIPQSSMWPALIRVVAPSRLTPNEPKILLPDLPEHD